MSYTDFNNDINSELRVNGNLTSDEVRNIVRDKWIKKKKYNDFISFFLQDYGGGHCLDFISPFCNHLVEERRFRLFKKIMTGVIRVRVNDLWDEVKNLTSKYDINIDELCKIDISDFNMYDFSEYSNPKKAVAFHRDFALQALNLYKVGLMKLDEQKELNACNKMITVVKSLIKPKAVKAIDKRKIDDSLFWSIIEEARKNSSDNQEFIEKLQESLEAFKKGEIKKFGKLVIQKCNELHTWKHWALAYIVRGGCGDDAFDYFKAWVVSKGEYVFQSILNFDEDKIKSTFNEDAQLEQLLYVAENAYENVAGDYMPEPKMKAVKISGIKFEENNIVGQYPRLCALFDYKDD